MQSSRSPSSQETGGEDTIDLRSCPSIFVLPTHISLDELHDIEEILLDCGAPLTYDITEARLAIGKVSQKKRAALELRSKGLWTEDVLSANATPSPSPKRLRVTENDSADILVLKLNWIHESLRAKESLPLDPYVVYRGRKVPKPPALATERTSSNLASPIEISPDESPKHDSARNTFGGAKGNTSTSPKNQSTEQPTRSTPVNPSTQRQRPRLYRASTSEFEEASSLPSPPEWVRDKVVYACCRSTHLHSPNEAFINQLQMIKKIRILTLDEIGVRAYSTSIAALAAYPYELKVPEEIVSLPGCDTRIANLFTEWKRSQDGTLESVLPLHSDPALKAINLFYDIWGVGAKSARDFYYQRLWRSLDDIVEQGWDTLSRVQQIGLKFYDEFLTGISKEETEAIADTILEHAKRVRPDSDFDKKGIECIIVGGYRRGKERSGDVDVILTHRDDRVTFNLVYDVVASLEQEEWITHTLALHLTNSHRDQQPLPYRGESSGKPRFDSLDKALVVWQNPNFDDISSSSPSEQEQNEESLSQEESPKTKKQPEPATQETDPGSLCESLGTTTVPAQENLRRSNPNPHRRVDIIVSPFRTIGCAVLGWSGDTTFERDLRRYAKKMHNWKFDSSGIRSREGSGGRIIDLESKGETWQEREKLVMEGLGIGWRPPTERCTR